MNFPNIPIQKPFKPIELHDPIELFDNINLMVGSPPCIGFSQANPNAREDHPANKHTLNFANWVVKVIPKYFLMEMVPNILTTGKSIWVKFRDIVRPYYIIDYCIMEASEYGAAQRRKRLYVWGRRKDLPRIESPLCSLPKKKALTIGELLLEGLSAKFDMYIPDGKQLMSMYKKDGTGLRAGPFSLLSTEEKRRKRTLKFFGQMYTIVGTSVCNCLHPSGRRFLSIPEIKLLMGFPVDYKLPAKLNAQQACRVIASGVDVRFASYLLEHIRDVIEE
jgi:site-specific DNA-cytosine methylase